jgi:hypothetical protein
VVCSIPATVIPTGDQRIATRIWLALRTARPTVSTELLDGPYALRIIVTAMNPGLLLKALVDGASTAMQRADPASTISECARRLAHAFGLPVERITDLLTTAPAPLGPARRLVVRDREYAGRVAPDDDRCVAAEVRSIGVGGESCVAVDLLA